MDAALASMEAFSEDAPAFAAAVDNGLLQTVPAPAPLDFRTLEEEVTHQRRLVVRAAVGIPVAGVLAIGGSLLIHAVLVGAFAASFYMFLHAPQRGGGSAAADDAEMGGGSHGGTLFISDVAALEPGRGQKVSAGPVAQGPVLPPVNILPPPIAPTKPPITPPSPSRQIAMNITPPFPNAPDIIGLPAGADAVGVIHTTPRPWLSPSPLAPPPAVGLPIMAPPRTPILATPVGSAGDVRTMGASSGTAARTSSPRPGPDDGMSDNDDEETISLLNPGHGGGVGTGGGRHRGNGIDRGPSGGDNETPGVLDPPPFRLPAEYEYHPPKQRVILTVTVLANGRAGDVQIKQSCGISEIDDAYKSLVAREYKFRPAYRDGKPFTATLECSQSFSTDDE
jgi:hypothetical protein